MNVSQTDPGGGARTDQAAGSDLRTTAEYLGLFWQFRWIIVSVTVLAGAATFAFSLIGPRSYESTVTFEATQSKLGNSGQISSNTATFRPMVASLTIAADVIQEQHLDKSPYYLTPSRFLDLINVNEIRGTNLLTVSVALSDPTMAASIANSVASHAVKTARSVSASEATYTRDLIKQELDQSRTRLDAADIQLRDYRRQVRIEVLRKEVEMRLGGPQTPTSTLRGQPPATSVYVDGQADSRMSVLELQRKIASEKARLAAMDRNDATLSSVRANVAALEQQRAELLTARPLDPGTTALLDRLYNTEAELGRRQVEHDLAERSFTDLSVKYQDALLQVIGKSAEFVIVDPAVPADRPLSRHVARNAAVACAICWALAMAGVLMWDTLKRRSATL